MSKPEGDPLIQGQQLASGDYIIAELQEVIPGSLEEMSEENRLALQNYLMQLTANSDFSAYMTGIEADADIER
jgi:hypothetical protein